MQFILSLMHCCFTARLLLAPQAWSSRNYQEEKRHLETFCSPATLRGVDGWKGEAGKHWRECCSVCLLSPVNGNAVNFSLGCKSFHLR